MSNLVYLTSVTRARCCVIDRKDSEINNLNGRLEDEQNLIAQLQKKIKEQQVRGVRHALLTTSVCVETSFRMLVKQLASISCIPCCPDSQTPMCLQMSSGDVITFISRLCTASVTSFVVISSATIIGSSELVQCCNI